MLNRQSEEPQSGAGKTVSELLEAQQAAKDMGDPDTCTGRRAPASLCRPAWRGGTGNLLLRLKSSHKVRNQEYPTRSHSS